MRIFVAGATGVIGRRLVPLLTSDGHEVTALVRSPDKRAAAEEAGANPIEADLFDAGSLRTALSGHDVAVNLATSIPPSSRAFLPGAWRENDRIRREGAVNFAAAAEAAGIERLVQESFAPVYPDRGADWIDESTPIQPARYNRTVADAEAAAERFTRSGGIGIVLRFAYFYGSDSDLMRTTISSVRKGWASTFGSPEGFISTVSHDDAATAVVAALAVPAGVYNVVDDEPLTRRAHFDALADALGTPPPKLPPVWLAKLAGSIGETLSRSQRISNRKLRQATGWVPVYPSVREGYLAVAGELFGAASGPHEGLR